MSKVAIVAGATGAVGKWIVKELIEIPEFSTVYTLVRRPNEVPQDAKVREILLTGDNTADFAKLPSNADVVFSGVGTTIKRAGSKEAFRKVDYDFNAELADAARRLKIPQFHLVSSVGADSSSSFFYLKVKGELEDHIKQLAFPHAAIYRPGVLSQADRSETRVGEAVGRCVMGVVAFILPFGAIARSGPIPVHDVAKAMVHDAVAFANKPPASAAPVPDHEDEKKQEAEAPAQTKPMSYADAARRPSQAQREAEAEAAAEARAADLVVYDGSAEISKAVKEADKEAKEADKQAVARAAPAEAPAQAQAAE
jgi:uncharacterized protein YbjT (DUF2867 family)